MPSSAEENYLKTIFRLEIDSNSTVPTGALASAFGVQAPSVTDMVKRLAEKKLLSYEKSKGVNLTSKGKKTAIAIIRKHRIWETFLVEILAFGWDEVHDLAEQLEHIKSEELTNRLEEFLGFPKFDPHGDPIPDKQGIMEVAQLYFLNNCVAGTEYKLLGIREDSAEFLKYLDKIGLKLGTKFKLICWEEFDKSCTICIHKSKEINFSLRVASLLSVAPV